jgi:hypothetical protein
MFNLSCATHNACIILAHISHQGKGRNADSDSQRTPEVRSEDDSKGLGSRRTPQQTTAGSKRPEWLHSHAARLYAAGVGVGRRREIST